jgi:SAM-dependent methyltransferase
MTSAPNPDHQHDHAGSGQAGGHGHGHAGHDGTDSFADLIDLDVQVLPDYWTAALDWVRDQATGTAPARLLDLGAGTGTAAIGLAGRFPRAQVTAVDIDENSLRLLRDRAAVYGLAPRVRAVRADLDAGWPDLGPLDLTWASMSLHHMADPGAVLRDALAATADGGLIAVAEFPEPLRFLPPDLGTGAAGFEDRVTAGLNQAHTEQMPTLGSAWAPRLTEAGWQVTAEREFRIDLDRPEHPRAGAYARGWFTRLAHGLTDRLSPDDQVILAALLDDGGPHAVARRTDLHIRGSRIVTVARHDFAGGN